MILFDGFRFGSITPTDVDAVVEYHGERIVLIEFKHAGAPVDRGQRVALERWIDAMGPRRCPDCNRTIAAPMIACCMVADHFIKNPAAPVRAIEATVRNIYRDRSWRPPERRTPLFDAVGDFLLAEKK